jgi:hypothetical protein
MKGSVNITNFRDNLKDIKFDYESYDVKTHENDWIEISFHLSCTEEELEMVGDLVNDADLHSDGLLVDLGICSLNGDAVKLPHYYLVNWTFESEHDSDIIGVSLKFNGFVDIEQWGVLCENG